MASKNQSRPPVAAPVKKEETVSQQPSTPEAGATAATEADVQQTATSEAAPVATSATVADTASTPAEAPAQDPVKSPEPVPLNTDIGKAGVVVSAVPAPVAATSLTPSAAPSAPIAPASANYSFQSKVDNLKKEGTQQTKTLIMYLEQYLVDMAPRKPLTSAEIVHRQQAFWKSALLPLIEQPSENFHQSFSILVGFFREYSEGAFHERYLFRGVEHFTQAKEQTDAFLALLNLIKILSKAVDRKTALRQVDLGRTFAGIYSEDARNRVIGYLTN